MRCLLIWAAANNEALSRTVFASSFNLMKCKVKTEERQRQKKRLKEKRACLEALSLIHEERKSLENPKRESHTGLEQRDGDTIYF